MKFLYKSVIQFLCMNLFVEYSIMRRLVDAFAPSNAEVVFKGSEQIVFIKNRELLHWDDPLTYLLDALRNLSQH